MDALAVISKKDGGYIRGLHFALQGFEASATRHEEAGEYDAADECWELAWVAEEQLESVLVELLDESGVSTTSLTEDDEAEAGFGESLYDSLLRIGMWLYGPRGDCYLTPDAVEPWPESPDAMFLGARDIADQLVAGGTLWVRHPLQDLDDPRRPPDSQRTCVRIGGRTCGPVYDVWECEGRFVGPATLLAMGARPARSIEEVAAWRLGESVRAVFSGAGASKAAVAAITDEMAREAVDDVFDDYRDRITRMRTRTRLELIYGRSGSALESNISAWLAMREDRK